MLRSVRSGQGWRRTGIATELMGATGWLVATHLGAPGSVQALIILLMIAGFGLAVSGRSARRVATIEIVAFAALLRLLVVPAPPTLSGDLYRYVWDGRVAAAGFNPYRLAPEAPELSGLRDANWERLDHKTVPTVYPPLALSVFALASATPMPVMALKGLFAAADLSVCVLLLGIASRLGLGHERVVWYAWNPLAVLESAASGHVDALGVALLLGALLLLLRSGGRILGAGSAMAASVLTKIVPLAMVPLAALRSRRPGRFLAVCLLVIGGAAVPLFVAGGAGGAGRALPGVGIYARSWEYLGALYEPLWRLLAWFEVGPGLKSAVVSFSGAVSRPDLAGLLNPYLYPQFVARIVLGVTLLVLVASATRRRSLLPGGGAICGALLVCSPVAWPWYGLWMLPFAALCRQPAFRALSLTLLAGYLPQLLGVPLWPWTWGLIWVPFFILWWRRPRWSGV